MRKLPSSFCWTRMGAESGQSLDIILKRKELERKAGNGIFLWGIGNPLGKGLWEFIHEVEQPLVLFSKIKSLAKKEDSRPERVFLWKFYIDKNHLIQELPKTSLLLSRGNSKNRLKKFHYGLICSRQEAIVKEEWENLEFGKLTNYEKSSKLGYSQITAIVNNNCKNLFCGPKYEVEFSAKLVDPFFVKLTQPLEVPIPFLSELNITVQNMCESTDEWKNCIEAFHSKVNAFNNRQKFHDQPVLPFT